MIRAAVSRKPGAPAEEIEWSEAKRLVASTKDVVVWVDVHQPLQKDIDELEREFKLHSLTIEDLLHRNQRAKVEQFADYLFVVMHWFSKVQQRRPCELHCVLGPNYLITVTDADGADVGTADPVAAAWARFRSGSVRGPVGADGLLYRVLDELVDLHVPRVDEIEEDLERVNERVVSGETTESVVPELAEVRRRLVAMRRTLAPERDAFGALARRDYALIDERTALFFRDLQDHVSRTYEAIESLRELDEMVMDVQLAIAEGRRSVVIERLTIVSTIFLPMNFLASFFGMNFTHIPFDSTSLLYGCLLAMAGLPALMMVWLLARRWI